MAKAKRTVITCDHKLCSAISTASRDDDLDDWLYGTATDTGDGVSIKWYACTPGHVVGAISHLFEEAREC